MTEQAIETAGEAPAAPAESLLTGNPAPTPEQPQQPTEQAAPQPVDYTDFIVPEAAIVDQEIMDKFVQSAKSLGLTQEQAQGLMTMGFESQQRVLAQHQAAIEQTKSDWREQALNDQEFGGDKLQENLAIASKFRDAFATPELMKVLDETGLGNHPELIRAFYRAGKAISEDSFVGGAASASHPQSIAQRMYPNMNP
jgi:hypothetical protein